MTPHPQLAREAKAIVALAFRNGPIEKIHADSRITQDEMRQIIKVAVDRVYTLLWLRDTKPEQLAGILKLGDSYAQSWDEPELTADF
jgi:hypothetical protein